MQFKGSNIFITGINGFVGSTAAKHFLDKGAHVIGLVKDRNKKSRPDILDRCSIVYGDICDKNVLDYVLSKYEIDYVLHLAAQPIVRICNNDPYMAYQTNVMGTINLLESCRTKIAKPQKVIVMTSVTGDTPILINVGGQVVRKDLEYLWKYAEKNGNKIDDEHYSINGISCLNVEDTSCKFSDLDLISRYKTNKDIFTVKYTGGVLSVAADHSLFVYTEDGQILEKRGDEIKEGDLLVTVSTGNMPKKDLRCSLYSMLNEKSRKILKTVFDRYDKLSNIDINDKYVLEFIGTYLSKGSCWIDKKGKFDSRYVGITINTESEGYLINIIRGFGDRYGFRFYHTTNGVEETYKFLSTELALFVSDIIGYKIKNKALKGSWAWSLSKAQLNRLLFAYTESIDLEFVTPSKGLAIDLNWLLRLHGYFSNISQIPINKGKLSTEELWYLTIYKSENILTSSRSTSRFDSDPFNKCYPSAYVKTVLDERGIQYSKDLLFEKGVSRKKVLNSSSDIRDAFVHNDLSYSVVTSVSLSKNYGGYVYDVSAKDSRFPSFMAGTSPVLCHNSDKAYGPHAKLPYKEDSELVTFDSYCTSKSCQDMATRSYAMTYNLPIVVVRAGNLYGPADLNTSRLIPRSILRLLGGESPVLYGGVSEFIREFIFVDDIIGAYEVLFEKGVNGEPYNVGGTKPQKIGEVISLMRDKIDKNISIEIEERAFKEINMQYLDASKLMALGWTPKVALDEGLDRSIEWYRNYLKNGGVSCR